MYQSAESQGYSRFNFSSALHRYISLPHAINQSAQLVPGTSGDTSLPLGRCSAIDTYLMSVSMASSKLSNGGCEGILVLKIMEEEGELCPLQAVVATIDLMAHGAEGV